MKYRFAGKEKRLSLGTYPGTSLADTREARRGPQLLAAGVDPSEQRKAVKAAGEERAANSFEVIAREWHAKQSATSVDLHASRIMLRLENDVFPWLGRRPIADIPAKEFLATINRVVDRGAVESAQPCALVRLLQLQRLRPDRGDTCYLQHRGGHG